jgi:hypothetical protein
MMICQDRLGAGLSDFSPDQVVALFFECFPYVCPEPVLVNKIVLYINGAKQVKEFSPALHGVDRARVDNRCSLPIQPDHWLSTCSGEYICHASDIQTGWSPRSERPFQR